ncbi:MAG: site-2 protease family protein [Neisseriales bacterium]|nr:MAG: site-2 protease family protein [Neisseriales bacterium]
MQPETIQFLIIYALPVLLAITIHEASHAYAARRFGDDTAYLAGRMTLNPLKHIDPLGTIIVPALSIALGGWIFGWAKPVPVNPARFRRIRQDMAWVAFAGPLANFFMALSWGVLHHLALNMTGEFALPFMLMSQAGIHINYLLMVFNLLPILPMDGGRIMQSLLFNRHYADLYARTEPYGTWLLIALLASGLLSGFLRYCLQHLMQLTDWLIPF